MSAVLLPKELDDYRVGELLAVWSEWMLQRPATVMKLGAPSRACGCHSEPWGYWPDTTDIEYEEMEWSHAPIVNAAIEDLPDQQQMAIYYHHIAAVYHFQRKHLGTMYDLARRTLARTLPARGIAV